MQRFMGNMQIMVVLCVIIRPYFLKYSYMAANNVWNRWVCFWNNVRCLNLRILVQEKLDKIARYCSSAFNFVRINVLCYAILLNCCLLSL